MSTTVSKNLDQGVVRIPDTITPISVSISNIILFGVIWVVMFFFLNIFLASIATGLILAASIWFGGIADEEVDYHGHQLFNWFTKKRRVIFPGLHQKVFWESMEEGSRESLRRIVSSKGEENLPTNDPAENMKIHLTIHKRMNIGVSSNKDKQKIKDLIRRWWINNFKGGFEEDKQAADNFNRFHSIDAESLADIVRKEIVKKFSGYYGKKEMEDLINADEVQRNMFNETEKSIKEKIKELQKRWGISIGVILDTSNPDEETRAMKKTPAMAEALAAAMKKLEKEVADPDMRRRIAMILDPNNDYTEERFDLHIDAPDLKNLQHASFMGFGDRKDKKGKGGKK